MNTEMPNTTAQNLCIEKFNEVIGIIPSGTEIVDRSDIYKFMADMFAITEKCRTPDALWWVRNRRSNAILDLRFDSQAGVFYTQPRQFELNIVKLIPYRNEQHAELSCAYLQASPMPSVWGAKNCDSLFPTEHVSYYNGMLIDEGEAEELPRNANYDENLSSRFERFVRACNFIIAPKGSPFMRNPGMTKCLDEILDAVLKDGTKIDPVLFTEVLCCFGAK